MLAPLAISPDGTLLTYGARDETGSHLFLRPLDSFVSRKIPGSENAATPFFSPDGQWIGFFVPGKLRKVSVVRGAPIDIANANNALGASWGPDDTIVFTPALNAGLWRVSAEGGTPEQLTAPDFGEDGYAHVWPQHLPDGRHVLFIRWGGRIMQSRSSISRRVARTWCVKVTQVGRCISPPVISPMPILRAMVAFWRHPSISRNSRSADRRSQCWMTSVLTSPCPNVPIWPSRTRGRRFT